VSSTNSLPVAVKDSSGNSISADSSGNLRVSPYGNSGGAVSKIVTGAGNVTISLTVPAGKKWLVYGGVITLVTNATVANRLPGLNAQDASANYLCANYAGVVTTASLTRFYSFGPGLPQAAAFAGVNLATAPFAQLLLGPGFVISSVVSAGVAGDTQTLSINVLELVD
jgi:hypothetical protein